MADECYLYQNVKRFFLWYQKYQKYQSLNENILFFNKYDMSCIHQRLISTINDLYITGAKKKYWYIGVYLTRL